MAANSNRLLSLDVMRGMTIAGMILVNNPGTWGHIYAPLRHAEWNGLTPTDLVFPFFMFIMGVSTFFSLRKYDFKPSRDAIWKILKRTFLIIFIGWAISWIARTWSGLLNPDKTFWEAVNNFAGMRTLGVFPRLGLCYGATALLAVTLRRNWLKWVIAGLLVAYTVLLLCGNGFNFADDSILSIVDVAVLGEAHMYHDTVNGLTLAFDPEGLLSTLPSIAHCLIGFLCGGMIVDDKQNNIRSYHLLIVGCILTFIGFLLDYGIPINKKIWSPTFVFTTCGLASSLLGLLIWIIDIKGWKRWSTFFHVFGVNPLYLYVQSTLFAVAMNRIRFAVADPESGFISLQQVIYKKLLVPLCYDDLTLASLCFAIFFVLLNWCVGYVLYRKKIYIKI